MRFEEGAGLDGVMRTSRKRRPANREQHRARYPGRPQHRPALEHESCSGLEDLESRERVIRGPIAQLIEAGSAKSRRLPHAMLAALFSSPFR